LAFLIIGVQYRFQVKYLLLLQM